MPLSHNNNQSFHLLSAYCVPGALCALSLILTAGTMNYPFLICKDEKTHSEKLSKTLTNTPSSRARIHIETHLIPISVLCASASTPVPNSHDVLYKSQTSLDLDSLMTVQVSLTSDKTGSLKLADFSPDLSLPLTSSMAIEISYNFSGAQFSHL